MQQKDLVHFADLCTKPEIPSHPSPNSRNRVASTVAVASWIPANVVTCSVQNWSSKRSNFRLSILNAKLQGFWSVACFHFFEVRKASPGQYLPSFTCINTRLRSDVATRSW